MSADNAKCPKCEISPPMENHCCSYDFFSESLYAHKSQQKMIAKQVPNMTLIPLNTIKYLKIESMYSFVNNFLHILAPMLNQLQLVFLIISIVINYMVT